MPWQLQGLIDLFSWHNIWWVLGLSPCPCSQSLWADICAFIQNRSIKNTKLLNAVLNACTENALISEIHLSVNSINVNRKVSHLPEVQGKITCRLQLPSQCSHPPPYNKQHSIQTSMSTKQHKSCLIYVRVGWSDTCKSCLKLNWISISNKTEDIHWIQTHGQSGWESICVEWLDQANSVKAHLATRNPPILRRDVVTVA